MRSPHIHIPSGLTIRGDVSVLVWDVRTRELLEKIETRNLVTLVGRNMVRDALNGTSQDLTHMALGTDNTAPASGDSALGNEVYRDVFTTSDESQDAKSVFRLSLGANDANGNTIVEAGLFDDPSAGNLFARVTFGGIDKDTTKAAQFNWTVNFNDS